ncbi:3'-5' exonuclease family protein [Methanohalophilus profundi]|uniref:ribonuclease H-like domain-containing protein n=1 Tax=Methanohalophilus profundi TaxID=2138083 RepID=UPI00101C5ACD|nr:ribonuclease H-like domain-containing protein [Methanohalophilus profundi]
MTYDNIKNPWKMRDGVVIFDIETEFVLDWSIEAKKELKFRCGVAFSYEDGGYHKFTDPKELVELLKKAKALVTYNGEGFDFFVLEKYGLDVEETAGKKCSPKGIRSFDIMHKIQELRPADSFEKKFPSMDEIIYSHYGIHKTKYDADVPEEVREHCLEDVEFTKRLYEEEMWIVPVKKRAKRRILETDYDNDLYGEVDYGEGTTQIVDFGIPIAVTETDYFFDGPDTIPCPLCGQETLFLYTVLKAREDTLTCSECGGITKFHAGTRSIQFSMTKEENESKVCPNCNKSLISNRYDHHGYGAGPGYISSGSSICKNCGKGCYEWEDDDTPGFRDYWKGKCCFCGK